VSTYTIGQTAERSGFSASSLRYYEGLGLIAPAERTASGYRLYDDRALSRLGFIARAKQLGCSLDEIADLVGVWDGERCGPVQKRLHDLVTEKLVESERQIEELTAFRDQLAHAATQLSSPAPDGPCSDECACMALDHATAPIVCTLTAGEVQERRQLLEWLRANLSEVDRTEHGMLLHFPAGEGMEERLRHFARVEQQCCRFWGFAVDGGPDGTTLRWEAPPAADDVVEGLLAWFRHDREDLSGLL
jgi:DNA-binding transcriptional MerR regulator